MSDLHMLMAIGALICDDLAKLRDEQRYGPDSVQAKAPPEPKPHGFPKTERHVISGSPGGGTVVELPRVGRLLEFSCMRPGCTFRRGYGTLKGAMSGISEHLLRVHRVVAVWRAA